MIRPLDLQTLYMNLDKVGKETAQTRDAVHNQQLTQAEKLTKDHDLKKQAVGKTDTDSETAKRVNEYPQKDGQGSPRRGKKKPSASAGEPDTSQEDVPDDFQDDRVGRHIDISG